MSKGEAKPIAKPSNETPKPRQRDTKCWRCQGLGHIASQCPNQRAMLVLPSGEIVIGDEEEYKDMPLLVEEGDDSQEMISLGLVTRRTLAVHVKD